MEDKRKANALKVLRKNYTIVGDGVAHRKMDEAFEDNSSLLRSVRDLISARNKKKDCNQESSYHQA
ncbi:MULTISPECIES: hypothetical protein [unclassified Oleiphilus]|uniref:hypothetical protein n=1 Tax=unclassified Oleiphilus TaxID=2631174 RepID=UPI0007C3239D|nr:MULTISPECIES: hypothetical protein [unclassified Oleiphilus]KZY65609.1 hypothetical protein A3738_08275 [Oleiphilus sp. HI0066]